MAHYLTATVGLLLGPSALNALNTCPGFPGYCSESFPGQTCTVVCSFGRNNVPLCQDDGTWTDIPRCIEHDPGVDEQIPGTCPGIPGYCAQGFLNQRCTFDCRTGADIDSICTADGTWSPYPVCDGDLRETRDGCDGCPGPVGGIRNRTAEAILSSRGQLDTNRPNNRVPKVGSIESGRRKIPSFAGSTKFGPIEDQMSLERMNPENQFFVGNDGRIQQRVPGQQQQAAAPRPQQQQPRPAAPRPQQQPSFQTRFQGQRPVPAAQRPVQQTQRPVQQQPQRPVQQQPQRPPQQFDQGLNTFQANGATNQPISAQSGLFNQIKNRINAGNRAQAAAAAAPRPAAPQPTRPAAPQPTRQAAPTRAQLPIQNFLPEIGAGPQPSQATSAGPLQTFGPFESVNLGGNQPQTAPAPAPARQPQPQPRARPVPNDNFFGEFQSVNLQG